MVLRRVLRLLGSGPSPDVTDIEIAVLRHQLAAADRLLLATLARWLPRQRWPAFLVAPATLLR